MTSEFDIGSIHQYLFNLSFTWWLPGNN